MKSLAKSYFNLKKNEVNLLCQWCIQGLILVGGGRGMHSERGLGCGIFPKGIGVRGPTPGKSFKTVNI